jgi:type 1 fimbriae regulatory protein FimB
MDRLLKAVKKNRYSTRDCALLLLMARHGLRVSEAITLRRDQIDFAASNLAVRRLKNGSQDHLLDSGMELISTRDFYPRQTALYMKWLANTRIATGVFSDIEF